MSPILLGLLFTPLFVIIAINRNKRARAKEFAATVEVGVDQHGAHRVLSDGRREEVSWDEVVEVDVFTTRKGPHKDAGGAVVLYGTEDRGCVIPLDRLEESRLLVHLGQLDGFRVNTVIDALRVDDRREEEVRRDPLGGFMPRPWQTTTVCWRRDGALADDHADDADTGPSEA
jgi:hypothetical protein